MKLLSLLKEKGMKIVSSKKEKEDLFKELYNKELNKYPNKFGRIDSESVKKASPYAKRLLKMLKLKPSISLWASDTTKGMITWFDQFGDEGSVIIKSKKDEDDFINKITKKYGTVMRAKGNFEKNYDYAD